MKNRKTATASLATDHEQLGGLQERLFDESTLHGPARARGMRPPWTDGTIKEEEIDKRYADIARFGTGLTGATTTIVKVFLHISYEEPNARLLERLENAGKRWRFNPGDIDECGHWPHYQQAYTDALRKRLAET